jgi:antitoxin CptB
VTGTARTSEGLDPRRRRVLFRAWHRGTREMDFILGQFVNAELERMSEADLDVFEHLLEAQDSDLYEWVSGRAKTPPEYDNDIFRRLLAFHATRRTD